MRLALVLFLVTAAIPSADIPQWSAVEHHKGDLVMWHKRTWVAVRGIPLGAPAPNRDKAGWRSPPTVSEELNDLARRLHAIIESEKEHLRELEQQQH